MKVVFSGAADRDLEAIRRYAVETAPESALAYVDGIVDRCRTIAESPYRYPLVLSQAERGLRRRRCDPHIIFYTVSNGTIDILRILHEKMDYMRFIAFDA